MGKILVLAEKPSVAKEIGRVLGCRQKGEGCLIGQNYIVTWALGHLITLAEPEDYDTKYKDWKLEDLPMLPKKMQTVIIKQTQRQFRAVSTLMRRPDVDSLVIATDAGREGELVARWIMERAHWRKPAKRLWVSSQTDKAIKEGFANLKPAAQYDNLYYSARARAAADWLVGLNITRALTCKHNAQLSAGRVQTPTLALIVGREEEIRRFVPKPYYNVRIEFDGFSALYFDNKGRSRLSDEASAKAVANAVYGKKGRLTELKKNYRFKAPPAAYDLTELQRDANKKYAYSAKETLDLMQSLYEHHKLLTYPRTDSRYISDDIVPTLRDRLKSIAVGPYAPFASQILKTGNLQTKYLVNNAKVSDHHAIMPTEEPVNLSRLSPQERNIYDLVVRRFLAVLSPPYEYEEIRLKIKVGNYDFQAKGQRVKTPGFMALYGNTAPAQDDDADDDNRSQELPSLKQGDDLLIKSANVFSEKTKPPARYNEASLLSAMENPARFIEDKNLKEVIESTSGLGTPATRADIIEKLFSSFYVERRGKELHPTSKAIQLINLVPEDLKSPVLTAKWEQTLQQIASGKAKEDAFVDEMRQYAASLVKKVISDTKLYTHDNLTRDKCPECGKFLLDVNGKKGRMLICQDRDCGYRKSVSILTNARCPNCHKKLEMRGEGDKKSFFCVCGYREKLSDFEKDKDKANKHEVKKYLNSQSAKQGLASSSLADQLAMWKDENS